MAAVPSIGSLVATHDFYRRRLDSMSSNSSCGSAEYPGNPGDATVPHHPGLPKADPGHWQASFFRKSILPFMATVLESPEHSAQSPQSPSSMVTGGQAAETMKKQPGNQTNTRLPS
uniref:pancreatic progenitor cell differentiation and proliferation factor-like isoform X2 n=1 Tax=Jaculus jaculus TaxID=51337 RepID=UPI000332FF64|nr:pancreatic progenitor cell differentiation and proliferation factor-like isoform X2 [Jaculus jaculus]